MRAKTGRTPAWSSAALATVMCALLNPLSVGPAIMALDMAGQPDGAMEIFEAVYSPLGCLPEPMISAIESWAGFCQDMVP